VSELAAARWRRAALAAVAAALVLRLIGLVCVDLIPEEAYYWSYAQHLDLSYLDHPPLVAWVISAGTWLFGHSEWSVRFGAIACSVVTAACCGALTLRWFGRTAAAASVALVAAMPFGFASGVLMTPDAPLTAAWAGSLLALWFALVELRPRAWPWVGVCLGAGLLAKYTIVLLAVGAGLFLLVDRRARAELRRPGPYLAAAVALALFAPVLLWNYQNDWASFLFQSRRRLTDPPQFGLHRLLGSVLVLLGPGTILALFALRRSRIRRALDAESSAEERSRRWRFAALAAAPPLVVFVLFSLAHQPKVNWTGPLWLALLPATAALLARANLAGDDRAGRLAVSLTAPSLWLALLGYGFGLHSLALGVPGTTFPNGTRWAQHWRAIAASVDGFARRVREETGASPVIVTFDRYATASLIGFYQPPGGPRWRLGGRALFGGGESLMYGYWTPPESIAGDTLLCVSDELEDMQLPIRFGRAGEIASIPVAGDDPMFVRAVYGYEPDALSGTKRKNAAASSTADSAASSSHMLPSSRIPSAARWSSPSSSGLAALALPSDSTILGAHSGRGSPLVSNTTALQSGPSLNTHITPAPRSSAEGSVNIAARPRTPSSSSSKSPSTSG
jgi:dolichol-phosphate mannosyltransferase